MKRVSQVLLVMGLATSLASCNVPDVQKTLSDYVGAEINLDLANATAADDGAVVVAGSLDFELMHHFTNYKQQCDTVQCGTETQQQCNPVQRCDNEYQCHPRQVCVDRQECSPVQRCTPGGQVCRQEQQCRDVPDSVCHVGPDGKQVCQTITRRECNNVPVCTQGPAVCRTDTVCREVPSCTQQQQCGYEQVCRADTVCQDVQVPKYCQQNCRQVPFDDQKLEQFTSQVAVRIHGIALKDVKSSLQQLVIGVEPNQRFLDVLANPGTLSKDLQPFFASFDKADQTLAALKSKGYKLAAGQNFLSLPSGFKPGDAATIELTVVSDGGKDAEVSAVGTEARFPPLYSDDGTGN